MRASVVILGFLATLTFALPEARPDAAISCQSVSHSQLSTTHQLYWLLIPHKGDHDMYL